MSFIVRVIIIGIDNPYCIIQLKTKFKSQSAARITHEHPARMNVHPDSCRKGYGFARFQG